MPIFGKKLVGTKSSPAQNPPATFSESYHIRRDDRPLEYQPLNSARNEIRLVRLERNRVSPGFSFDLLKVSISDAPPYTALSYAWGEGSKSVYVPTEFGSCRVSNTLIRFFEQVQESDEDSKAYYWVDAICIDQSNVAERNEQVLRMKEIYEAAEQIVVWLNAHHIFPPDLPDFPWVPGNPRLSRLRHPAELEDVTLIEIFRCAWWKRAWIIQEASTPAIRNTSQTIVMWIGRYRYDFDDVLQASERLRESPAGGNDNHRLPPMVDDLAWIRVQRAQAASRLEIYDLLPRVRRCEASDMRDKIYSILAISCDYDAKDLKPEYGKPTAEIYTSLVRYLIERDQKLDILAYCTAGRSIESLPSWVPGKAP
jgi:hypothetical protein